VGNSTPWTKLEMEMDVPPDTYQVWAWLLYNAPSEGRVYFDDASLEIVGSDRGTPARPGKSSPPRKPGSGSTGSR